MSSVESYMAKAVRHLEHAQAVDDPAKLKEALRLALSYLRLAEMARKNAGSNLVSETPAKPVLQQQQIQPDRQR